LRENLIRERKKLGFKQGDFAKVVKIERTKYNKIERSRADPSFKEVMRILDFLNSDDIKVFSSN
jgi:DNA-binding XRE family transcriptional regulator